jgi:hypothetical protein
MQQLQKRCFNSLLSQHLVKFLIPIFKIYFLTKFHIFLKIPKIISCSSLSVAIFKLSLTSPTIFKLYITFVVDARVSNNLQILYHFYCRSKSLQHFYRRYKNVYIAPPSAGGHDVEIFKIAIFIYREMEHSKDNMHNAFCS